MLGAKVNGTLRLLAADGRELMKIDNESYKDKRSSVTGSSTFGSEQDQLTLELIKLSSPPIWLSVVRSVSFSLADIIQKVAHKESWSDFVGYIAIPRSAPAYSFLVALFFVFMLVRLKTNALIAAIETADDDLDAKSAELDAAEIRLDQTNNELDSIREKETVATREKERLKWLLVKVESDRKDMVTQQAIDLERLAEDSRRRMCEIGELKLKKKEADRLNQELNEKASSLELESEKDKIHSFDLQHDIEKQRQEIERLELELAEAESEHQDIIRRQANDSDRLAEDYKRGIRDADAEIDDLMLKMKIADHDKQELVKKVSDKEQKIKVAEADISNLNDEIDNLNKEIKEWERKSGQPTSSERAVVKAFLVNPNVRTVSDKIIVNKGKHHSMNYVQSIADSISSSKSLVGVCISITGSRFNSHKKGTAELAPLEKNKYLLYVYDQKDEGYGAEIVLTAVEYWEAVVQAKCIIIVALGGLGECKLKTRPNIHSPVGNSYSSLAS